MDMNKPPDSVSGPMTAGGTSSLMIVALCAHFLRNSFRRIVIQSYRIAVVAMVGSSLRVQRLVYAVCVGGEAPQELPVVGMSCIK